MDKQTYIESERIKLADKYTYIILIAAGPTVMSISLLDYFAMPEHFWLFLKIRIVTSLAYMIELALYIMLRRSESTRGNEVFTSLFFIIATVTVSLMVAMMIYHSGGHASPYWAGYLILLVFVLGITPSTFKIQIICVLLSFLFYLVPILIYDEIVDEKLFINHVGFLAACCIFGVLWSYVNHHTLIRKLALEYELDRDKELLAGYSNKLEELVDERTQQLVHAQRVESMATMASGLAHDFNNILVSLQSLVDSVRYGKGSAEQVTESIDSINTEIKKGSHLVTKILEFRKGVKSEKVAININDVIRERAEIFKGVLPSGIQLKVELFERLPEVMADTELLEQVITNMVMNAKDAMPGGGTVTLTTSARQKDANEFVVLTVSDTGTGIEKKHLPFIFDPFYSSKKKGEGSGLGLATSDTIIKGHGGFIDIESVPGMGTAFSINLPIQKKRADSERRTEAKKTIKAHILVIDDDEPITEMISKVLTDEGYAVTAFNNPVEALDYFKNNGNNVDIVITDIVMPYMDGRQLIREVRVQDAKKKIVAITSLKGETASTLKVDEIMRKPIPKESLISIAKSVLRG